jgi:hypothetical protein
LLVGAILSQPVSASSVLQTGQCGYNEKRFLNVVVEYADFSECLVAGKSFGTKPHGPSLAINDSQP